MSDHRWEINVPHYSRDDPLTLTAGLVRHLPDVDHQREITRWIALDAAQHGLKTAGGLIDYLHVASVEDRKALIDAARRALGLERVEDIEAAEAFRRSTHGPTQVLVNDGRWVSG